MKNLFPILLVLFVFTSCKDGLEKTKDTKSTLDLTSVKAGPDPIPFELAKKMINNYGKQNVGNKPGNKILSSTDIAPMWLGLDDLASLVFSMKNEKADGIRLYFAQFGDNGADEDVYRVGLEESYSFANTLIVTGTRDSLVKEANKTESHYHKDYLHNGAPLAFISSSTISGLRPIPFKLANYMVKNYDANKAPVTDATGQRISNMPNTRAIWLNLDKLEAFVSKLQQEKADGINIYFATYGDNIADEKTYNAGLEKDHSYRNTIILMGAKGSTATGTNGVKTKYHLDSFNNNAANGSAGTLFTPPVNNGEQCPLSCNGATAF